MRLEFRSLTHWQGVFMKLAQPDGKFIITPKAAGKVAGHELKNCSSYFQVRELHHFWCRI
jgi:hypothetical protein